MGVGALMLMLLVTPPLAALIIAAYAAPATQPMAPLTPALQTPPEGRAQWHFLVCLVLWNSCGYDSAGMVAAEVADAPRTYPLALGGALVLTTLSYLVPLAACTAAVPPAEWREWGEGQLEHVGAHVGGPPLEYALLAASVAAEVGVLCTLMLTTSRALVAMAQLRMLPAPLARLHPSLGTPWIAIALNASLIALATNLLHFEALIDLSMVFYAINALVQCATVLRLRRTHPHRLRPRLTLPAPLLLAPAACALLLLGLTPWRTWLAAVSLLVATLVAYAVIHLARLTKGHRFGAPPSARATAAVEALAVVVPPFADGVAGGGGDGGSLDDGERSVDAGEESAAAAAGGRRHGGRGDAWFGQLLPAYRRVPGTAPDREAEHARASSAVAAFEMTERERAHFVGARDDARDDDDHDDDGARSGTGHAKAVPVPVRPAGAPSELPLTCECPPRACIAPHAPHRMHLSGAPARASHRMHRTACT